MGFQFKHLFPHRLRSFMFCFFCSFIGEWRRTVTTQNPRYVLNKWNITIQYTTQLFTYLFLSFLPNYLLFASYFSFCLFPSLTFTLSPYHHFLHCICVCICVFFLFNSLPQIFYLFLPFCCSFCAEGRNFFFDI